MGVRATLRTFVGIVVLFGSLVAATACMSAGGRMYLRVGPPAPIVEARIVQPGPGYVWLPGHYFWNGFEYVWRPGVWVRPPRGRAVWAPGHWVNEGRRGYFWVEGRWR